MKILLTGATGFVGRHLAIRLAEDGHAVTCLVRKEDSPITRDLKSLGAQLAVGNILDADSVIDAASNAGTVIHLVGIIFEPRGATFEQVHVEGTRNVLAAARKAGARRFVHMSAIGTGPDAQSSYLITKWKAEETVRAGGLDYTIFRPSIIYGPGGEFINMLMRQARLSPLVPVIGDGCYRMQPISVFDVAACFSHCLTNDNTVNQIYELGGPEALTYNEMVDIVCEALGKKRKKIHIPIAFMRLVAAVSEKLMNKPLLTKDQLNMLLAGSTCDAKKMRDDFGFNPVSFSEGLKGLLTR